MEDTYSVATNNRFALFMDDEDDPGDEVLQESRLPDKATVTGKSKSESNESKSDKSPKNKKKDAKDKGQTQPGKKAQGETPGKRKEAAPATEKSPSKDKVTSSSTGDKPRGPRDNRRTGSGPPNERNERSNENRPPRQQFRGRGGRLPSRENQDGQQGPSGGGFEDSTYNNSDSRSRPRWNRDRMDRGDRVSDRVERGEREGERGGFRPSRGRGGFRGGKREFERRSGSDKSSVKPIDKREGAGAHNWGTMKDDIDNSDWPNEETEQTEPTIQPTNTEDTEDKKPTIEEETTDESQPVVEEGEVEGKEKEENGEEEVEDVPQLTLDEYKALQEKKRNVPLFKERRAGEDEDQTQWKNMIVYERQEEEFFPGTREIVEKLKTSGREKTLLESSFYFRDVKRFTGGRGGGRGGGVGGKREDRKSFGNDRRGGDRRRPGGRNRDRSQFNVEDEKDFPSLGTVSA